MGAQNTKIETDSTRHINVSLYPAPKQVTPSNNVRCGRALLIGITYYKTDCPLNGTFNDSCKVKTVLKNKGFSEDNIIFLTDKDMDPQSVYYPTNENITRAIKWLFSSSTKQEFENKDCVIFSVIFPKQLCFFYYSGHGTQVKDLNGDESDNGMNDGLDECICPVKSDGNFDNYIIDDTLSEIVNNYTNETTIVVSLFDSCHSGSIVDLPFVLENNYIKKKGKYPPTKCILINISGCLDQQSAFENFIKGDNNVQGYLTYSWVNILTVQNYPSISYLERNIKSQVGKLITSSKQIPVMSLGKPISISYKYPL